MNQMKNDDGTGIYPFVQFLIVADWQMCLFCVGVLHCGVWVEYTHDCWWRVARGLRL